MFLKLTIGILVWQSGFILNQLINRLEITIGYGFLNTIALVSSSNVQTSKAVLFMSCSNLEKAMV